MLTRTLLTADPFARMSREMDRLFDSMTQGAQPGRPDRSRGFAFPAINLWQDQHSVHAEAELPGVEMDNIEVLATSETLTIRGSRTLSTPQDATVLRSERLGGAFERSLSLPTEVDTDGVEAVMTNGVLRITLPKAQRVLPRRVQVRALHSGS
jgi:HSP20 family protein